MNITLTLFQIFSNEGFETILSPRTHHNVNILSPSPYPKKELQLFELYLHLLVFLYLSLLVYKRRRAGRTGESY
jgi:hypothetical protein